MEIKRQRKNDLIGLCAIYRKTQKAQQSFCQRNSILIFTVPIPSSIRCSFVHLLSHRCVSSIPCNCKLIDYLPGRSTTPPLFNSNVESSQRQSFNHSNDANTPTDSCVGYRPTGPFGCIYNDLFVIYRHRFVRTNSQPLTSQPWLFQGLEIG